MPNGDGDVTLVPRVGVGLNLLAPTIPTVTNSYGDITGGPYQQHRYNPLDAFMPTAAEIQQSVNEQEQSRSRGAFWDILALPEKVFFGQAIKGAVRGFGEGGLGGAVEGFARGTPFAFFSDWLFGTHASRETQAADIRRAFGDTSEQVGAANFMVNLAMDVLLDPITLMLNPLGKTAQGLAKAPMVAGLLSGAAEGGAAMNVLGQAAMNPALRANIAREFAVSASVAKAVDVGDRAAIVLKLPWAKTPFFESNLGFKSIPVNLGRGIDATMAAIRTGPFGEILRKFAPGANAVSDPEANAAINAAKLQGEHAKTAYVSGAEAQLLLGMGQEALDSVMKRTPLVKETMMTLRELGILKMDDQGIFYKLENSELLLAKRNLQRALENNPKFNALYQKAVSWDGTNAAERAALETVYRKYPTMPLPESLLELAGLPKRFGVELPAAAEPLTQAKILGTVGDMASAGTKERGIAAMAAKGDTALLEPTLASPAAGVIQAAKQRQLQGIQDILALPPGDLAAVEKWLEVTTVGMQDLAKLDAMAGLLNAAMEFKAGPYVYRILTPEAKEVMQAQLNSKIAQVDAATGLNINARFMKNRKFDTMLTVEANAIAKEIGTKATGYTSLKDLAKAFEKHGEDGFWGWVFDKPFLKRFSKVDESAAEAVEFFSLNPMLNDYERVLAGGRAIEKQTYINGIFENLPKAETGLLDAVENEANRAKGLVGVVRSTKGAKRITEEGRAVQIEREIGHEAAASYEVAKYHISEDLERRLAAEGASHSQEMARLRRALDVDPKAPRDSLVPEPNDPLSVIHAKNAAKAVQDAEKALLVAQHPPPPVIPTGQFHGSVKGMTDLKEGYYNRENIYGGADTLYTTDSHSIAGGYAGKSGKIYTVTEKYPVKFFDMEAKKPASQWLKELPSNPQIVEAIRGWDDILAANGRPHDMNLRELMDEMRRQGGYHGWNKDDVQEGIGAIHKYLKGKGYGGMSHTGGLMTHKPEHLVKIYFDPHKSITLGEVPAAKIHKIDVEYAKQEVKRAKQDYQMVREAVHAQIDEEMRVTGSLTESLTGRVKDTRQLLSAQRARGITPAMMDDLIPLIRKMQRDGYTAVDEAATTVMKDGRTVLDAMRVADPEARIHWFKPEEWDAAKAHLKEMTTPDPWRNNPIAKALDWVKERWAPYTVVNPLFVNTRVRDVVTGFMTLGVGGMRNPKAIADAWGIRKAFNDILNNRKTAEEALGGIVLNMPSGPVKALDLFNSSIKDGTIRATSAMAGDVVRGATDAAAMNAGKIGFTDVAKDAISFFFPLKKGTDSAVTRWGMRNAAYLDDWVRLSGKIDGMYRGMSELDAAQHAANWTYDASRNITSFERYTMRRIIPFYAYAKWALGKTIDTYLEKPGVTAALQKIRDAAYVSPPFGGAPMDPAQVDTILPQFLKDGLGIPYKNSPEGPRFFMFGSYMPAGELNQLVEGIRGMFDPESTNGMISYIGTKLHPALKLPVEFLVNRDLFTDRDIEKFPGEQREFMGLTLTGKQYQLARNLRFLTELDRLHIFDREQAGQIVAAQAGGEAGRPLGQREELSPAERFFGSAFGILPKNYLVDVQEDTRFSRMRAEQKANETKGLLRRSVIESQGKPAAAANVDTLKQTLADQLADDAMRKQLMATYGVNWREQERARKQQDKTAMYLLKGQAASGN